jgi:hypothetical protein
MPLSRIDEFKRKISEKLGINTILTRDDRKWQLQHFYLKPGIQTPEGEYFAGGNTNPDLYGYRLGTLEEVKILNLQKQNNQLTSANQNKSISSQVDNNLSPKPIVVQSAATSYQQIQVGLNKISVSSPSPMTSPSVDELHKRLEESERKREKVEKKYEEELRRLREKQETQESELRKLKQRQSSGDEEVGIDMGDQMQSQMRINSQARSNAFNSTAFDSPLHLQRQVEEVKEHLKLISQTVAVHSEILQSPSMKQEEKPDDNDPQREELLSKESFSKNYSLS